MNKRLLPSKIGAMALEAMLFEVSATPKPGLVDRANQGAHNDMDFFTFMRSTASLQGAFNEFIQIGLSFQHLSPQDLLPHLQKAGQRHEKDMFRSTGGVNTHKGMIFSMGLVCGAIGWLAGKQPFTPEAVGDTVAEMCSGLCSAAFAGLESKMELTKGERMYLAHGFTGARGEAESGFATIRFVSYPVLCELLEVGLDCNDALVHTLLHLIAQTTDTNIVSRHNIGTAEYAQMAARDALALGGMKTEEGHIAVEEMDKDFIRRHISPGGCADLLAVTYLLVAVEKEFAVHNRGMRQAVCR